MEIHVILGIYKNTFLLPSVVVLFVGNPHWSGREKDRREERYGYGGGDCVPEICLLVLLVFNEIRGRGWGGVWHGDDQTRQNLSIPLLAILPERFPRLQVLKSLIQQDPHYHSFPGQCQVCPRFSSHDPLPPVISSHACFIPLIIPLPRTNGKQTLWSQTILDKRFIQTIALWALKEDSSWHLNLVFMDGKVRGLFERVFEWLRW